MTAMPMIGRTSARRPEQLVRFEPSNDNAAFGRNAANDNLIAAEKRFGEDVLAILEQHYPSHFWYVVTDFRQGIAHISIPILMGPTQKYVLHLDRISDPTRLANAVKDAGGEILERFRIPRGSLDLGLSQFLDARENLAVKLPKQSVPT